MFSTLAFPTVENLKSNRVFRDRTLAVKQQTERRRYQMRTMNMPGFTAEASCNGARNGYRRRKLGEAQGVTPAMDPKTEDHKECIAECHAEGGKNCAARCRPQQNVGYRSAPGTSDAQAACCMGLFAGCLASFWASPWVIGFCYLQALTCTQSEPSKDL